MYSLPVSRQQVQRWPSRVSYLATPPKLPRETDESSLPHFSKSHRASMWSLSHSSLGKFLPSNSTFLPEPNSGDVPHLKRERRVDGIQYPLQAVPPRRSPSGPPSLSAKQGLCLQFHRAIGNLKGATTLRGAIWSSTFPWFQARSSSSWTYIFPQAYVKLNSFDLLHHQLRTFYCTKL